MLVWMGWFFRRDITMILIYNQFCMLKRSLFYATCGNVTKHKMAPGYGEGRGTRILFR
jgi:hypothetical protein